MKLNVYAVFCLLSCVCLIAGLGSPVDASSNDCADYTIESSARCLNGSISSQPVCDQNNVCTWTCTGASITPCSSGPKCGNGILESGEVCDLLAFGAKTCASYGYSSGKLFCDQACNIITKDNKPFGCFGLTIANRNTDNSTGVSLCGTANQRCTGSGFVYKKDLSQLMTCADLQRGKGVVLCNPKTCDLDSTRCSLPAPSNMINSDKSQDCLTIDANQVNPDCRPRRVNILKPNSGQPSFKAKRVSSELIVKFKNKNLNLNSVKGIERLQNLKNRRAFNISSNFAKSNLSVVTPSGVQTKEQLKKSLEQEADVEIVEYNVARPLSSIPTNDTYRARLWGLDNTGQNVNGVLGNSDADIDAPEAWALNVGSNSDIIVAVIDTGVNYNHPDFAGQMWDGTNCLDQNGNALNGCNSGYDFVANDKTPLPSIHGAIDTVDELFHGTQVAGVIASAMNNNAGVIGIAPRVKIMALRFNLDLASEIAAIDFAIQNDAKVINASFGGTSYSLLEQQAIARFRASGGIFIAAAGNGDANGVAVDNDLTPFYPASHNLDNIISVVASDSHDNKATWSNHGTVEVDVAAPGVNIYSTSLGTGLAYSQSFDLTVPNIPSNWTKSGNWGTVLEVSDKVLYGDYNQLPYASNANASVTTQAINLSGKLGQELTFNTRCDTEYNNSDDKIYLEFSSDGSTFVPVYSYNEYSFDQAGGDSNSSGFSSELSVAVMIDESYYTPNFKIRWRWVTDADNNNFYGCYIDDVVINSYTVEEAYKYASGTSSAAPYVAGLAGLIWGAKPDLTYGQVRSLILDQGDSLASLTNYTVTGKRINAYKSLAVFKPSSGSTADDVISANQISQSADSSGTVTINFRTRATWPNLPITLNSLAYSIDNGVNWLEIASSSSALSANWSNNNYLSSTTWSGATYNFRLNTKHSDLSALNVYNGTVRFRFKPTSTVTSGNYVISEAFTLVNETLPAPLITQPSTALTVSSATYHIIGLAQAGAIVKLYDQQSVLLDSIDLEPAQTVFDFTVDLTQGQSHNFSVTASNELNETSVATPVPTISRRVLGLNWSPLLAGKSSPYYINNQAPQLTFSMDQVGACRFADTDLAYTAMSPSNDCTVTPSFNVSCDLPNQGVDGVKQIYVACQDINQNSQISSDNYELSFTLDTVAPSLIDSTISPTVAQSGTVSIDLNFGDLGLGLDYTQLPTVLVEGLESSPYQVTRSEYVGAWWRGEFELADDDEDNTASVSISGVKDLAGNEMISHDPINFIVDNIAPQAIISGGPGLSTASSSAVFTIGGSGLTQYRYRTRLGDFGSIQESANPINLTGLGLGFQTLEVIGADQAGNWQSSPSKFTWAVYGAGLEVTLNNGQYDFNASQAQLELAYSSGVSATTSLTLTSSSTNLILNFEKASELSANQKQVLIPASILTRSNTSLGLINFDIPANTLIRSVSTWDALFKLPNVLPNSSVTVTPTSGYTASVNAVVEIGSGNTALTLSRAVRLALPGQAGKLVGYYRNGVWYRISATCSADTQVVGDALASDAECVISVGADMIIYSKHLTSFVVYTQTAISSGGGSSGGGSSGGGSSGGGSSSGSSGGGGGSATPTKLICTTVEYGDWQAQCVNGWQLRLVAKVSPTACTLTTTQEAERKRPCTQQVVCDSVEFGAWPIGCLQGWQYRSALNALPKNCVLTIQQNLLLRRSCGQADLEDQSPRINIPTADSERSITLTNSEISQLMSRERQAVKTPDNKLIEKYLGRIISQSEANNRLWYLNPVDKRRYYIGQNSSVDWAIKKLGTVYNDTLLSRIPIGGFDYLLQRDSDGDWASDALEAKVGTNAYARDTDGDGYADGEELKFGYSPLERALATLKQRDLYEQFVGEVAGQDSDGDGLNDELELAIGTNKNKKDTDADGYSDGVEIASAYNPFAKGKLVLSQDIINRNKGKILVSSKGRAWYINPLDGKRYFLGVNKSATLKRLALQLSNLELWKIRVAD